MMGLDPGVVLLGVLCALSLPLLLLGAIYLGARALGSGGHANKLNSARALLDRRLAEGAIDVDEYYERESALRDSEATEGRRR
jgi:uncharacterized membrane protein